MVGIHSGDHVFNSLHHLLLSFAYPNQISIGLSNYLCDVEFMICSHNRHVVPSSESHSWFENNAKPIGCALLRDANRARHGYWHNDEARFQRAVLNRIPRIDREPTRAWRQSLSICDEYHAFATVGENDPSGDEKFFALSRQAKCIAVVATQSISSLRPTLPGESWRTLLQTFRTKIFLALADDFSAKCASELCGKEEQLKLQYNLAENSQDAGVSVLTGRAGVHKATLSTSKGYNVQRDFVFAPKIFSEPKNAQATVLAYDGLNPHPPTYCYLKPYYLDTNTSYFEQFAKGGL